MRSSPISRSCEPVCRTCNLDPINRLTEELRSEASGESEAGAAQALLAEIVSGQNLVEGMLKHFGHEVPEAQGGRRLIPVQPA